MIDRLRRQQIELEKRLSTQTGGAQKRRLKIALQVAHLQEKKALALRNTLPQALTSTLECRRSTPSLAAVEPGARRSTRVPIDRARCALRKLSPVASRRRVARSSSFRQVNLCRLHSRGGVTADYLYQFVILRAGVVLWWIRCPSDC